MVGEWKSGWVKACGCQKKNQRPLNMSNAQKGLSRSVWATQCLVVESWHDPPPHTSPPCRLQGQSATGALQPETGWVSSVQLFVDPAKLSLDVI